MQPFRLLKSIIYERVNNRQKNKGKEVEKNEKNFISRFGGSNGGGNDRACERGAVG